MNNQQFILTGVKSRCDLQHRISTNVLHQIVEFLLILQCYEFWRVETTRAIVKTKNRPNKLLLNPKIQGNKEFHRKTVKSHTTSMSSCESTKESVSGNLTYKATLWDRTAKWSRRQLPVMLGVLP